MKKILFITFSILFLSGCSGKSENQSAKDTKLQTTAYSRLSKDEDCYKHKQEIETKRQMVGKQQNTIEQYGYVDALFYSPKVNSCVYVYRMIAPPLRQADLTDVFTGQTYNSLDTDDGDDLKMNRQRRSDFENIIYEYRKN